MHRTCMDFQMVSRRPTEMQVGLLPSTFKDDEYTTKDKVRKKLKCSVNKNKVIKVQVDSPGGFSKFGAS